MSVAWCAAPDITITVKVEKQEFLKYEGKKNDYKRQKLMGEAGGGGYWYG